MSLTNITKDNHRSLRPSCIPCLFLLLLLLSTAARAQTGRVNFTGRVMDAENQQPIGYAAVRLLLLPDSTLLAGGVTQADGKFSLTTVLPHTGTSASPRATAGSSPRGETGMLLHVSFVGYSAVGRPLTVTSRKPSLSLGDISLLPAGFLLEETVITAQAPQAITVEDTTVYTSSAYRTPAGAMLEDLVKQLPGGEITSDGKLMIQGKEVKKILVDGKEFFSDDPKAALKNLPVEMVEKLKAYERKSALARLTGVDDGEEEMILDLSVKKEMKQGWMNNFLGGGGNKERYEIGNTLNRFRENSQLTLIANLNNTNNQGFSELQQESSTASGNTANKAGLLTSRSLGMNLSRDWSRVKVRSNVQYAGSDRSEDSQTTVDNFLRADKSISHSTNQNHTANHNLTANAFVEWKIDSVTNLIFQPQYRYTASDRENSNFQRSWANDSLLNEKESSSEDESSRYNFSLMLQINRKLSRMGRNIALKADYGTNASTSDKSSFATTHYYKNNTERIINQRINNEGDGYNYRLQLIYVEPLPWLHFLQFRYSYQHQVSRSDRSVYEWDKRNDDFFVEPDSAASNRFENQYSNHLFNLGVRTSRKMYNYNIGVDIEPQKSVSYSYPGEGMTEPFTKHVLNFSPTVNFRYKFSKRTRLQVVYRGKSKQPNIRDLQPIADKTNPLNIRLGNPALKPSYTHTFTLNYHSYQAKQKRNLVLSLLVENTMNSITSQVNYDSETGGRTTLPVNVNGNWRAQGSFSLNTPLWGGNWLFRTYTYGQYRNQNGYTTLNKEAPIASSVQHTTGREQLKLTYRNQQWELSALAEVLYNNSYNNVRDTRTETFDYKAGGDLLLYLPWGTELNSDIVYRLREGYGTDEGRKSLMWNAQLSKSLLKKKQLLLRFKVYDILRQETSLVRTISATAIRDTDSNVLGSYCMLHLVVRLNRMGK